MSKLTFSAPERNKQPILEVLQNVVSEKFGSKSKINVLEIAAGTGQHALYFSQNIKSLVWHPTDIDQKHIESIQAYIDESGASNVRSPFILDICDFETKNNSCLDEKYDILVAINLIHISHWNCTKGLFKTAGKLLSSGGILLTYGPYSMHGNITPSSNVVFNQSLMSQNADWGLRDIDDLELEAEENGLILDGMIDMPANNKSLIWLKQ